MKNLFSKIISSATEVSKGDALVNKALSPKYKDLENLFDKLIKTSEISYHKQFEEFSECFISYFGCDAIHNDNEDNFIGHPTSLVQHIVHQFLTFIQVDTGVETITSLTYLTSNKYKGNKKTDGLNTSLLFNNSTDLVKINLFLRITHVLSILCKWQHNRNIITTDYGVNFSTICVLAFSNYQQIIDDYISLWCSIENSSSKPSISIVLHSNGFLSFGIVLTNIITRMLCTSIEEICQEHKCFSVGSIPAQPWEVLDMRANDFQIFISLSESDQNSVDEIILNKGSPMKKNSNKQGSAIIEKGLDKIYIDSIATLISVIRKLNIFLMATAIYTVNKSNLDLRSIRLMTINFQNQLLFSLSCFLTDHPLTSKVFRSSDGQEAIDSMLYSLQDISPTTQLQNNVEAELLLQRTLLVLHCQEINVNASFQISKNSFVSLVDLETTIENTKSILSWLNINAENEKDINNSNFPEELLKSLNIECKSPQSLETKLPSNDIYPWDVNVTNSTTFNSNMVNGIYTESLCFSLTNVFKSHWLERTKSLSSDGDQVFDPSKTLLYALVGVDSSYKHSTLSSIDLNADKLHFFIEYLNLPSGRMINQLLSKLYILSWKYTEKSYALPDPMIYLRSTLRLLLNSLESSINKSKSSSQENSVNILLIYTILFVARCTKYNPQKTIQICREVNLWKSLLVFCKLSKTEESSNTHHSIISNKFLSVTSGEVVDDSSIYHVVWEYVMAEKNESMTGSDTSSPNKSQLGISVNASEYLVAAATMDLDTSLISYGEEESDLFRSRTNSNIPDNSIFPVIIDSDIDSPSGSPLSYTMVRKRLHSSSNLSDLPENIVVSDTNDDTDLRTFSMLTIDKPPDSRPVSLRLGKSLRQDFLKFFAEFLIKDMVMELIRICCHFSYLVHALVDTSFDNSLSLDFEALELANTILSGTSDESIVIILRWLSNLADFHNQLCIQSYIWTIVAKRCVSLSKILLDSLNTFASSTTVNSAMILDSRPLFWPVRAAAIQLITKILYSPCSKDWIDAFVPNVDSTQVPSVLQRPVRHTVIIRLILDPLCRDFAISIVAKILQTCAELLYKKPPDTGNLTKLTQRSMIEALAHDIIKGLLNTLITAPQQPSGNDSSFAVIKSIHAIIVFLRNPVSLTWNKESILEAKAYQEIFSNYGAMTPSHAVLGWSYSRYNIFRDLLASLNATFKRAYNWDKNQKVSVMNYGLAWMTAIMVDNDQHKEIFHTLLMQKTRRKSSNIVMASVSSVSNTYHDMISMIVSIHDGIPISKDTIFILFEILLDGFPYEIRFKLSQTPQSIDVEKGFFEDNLDSPPKIENFTAIHVLLNIAYFCDKELQCCIINTIHNLIGGNGSICVINLAKCLQMQPALFDVLLDIFPRLLPSAQGATVKILQLIGRNTVNVAQLKRIFRLLQLQDNKRPTYTWSLLDAMEGMIVTASIPRYYFFFQGNESGLRLPTFKKWPAMKGFSFSTWFCIDSPLSLLTKNENSITSANSISKSINYHPRLLCFRQESGSGFEISLKPTVQKFDSFTLLYTVFIGMNSVTAEIGIVAKSKLKAQGWHHLAFSHCASNFRSKSELTVFLNYKKSQHTISFPRFTEEVKFPTVGDVSPNFKDESQITGFFGQVSTIYFFSDPLADVYLQGIYELGPAYSQLFCDKESSELGIDSAVSIGPNFTKVQDGYLSSTIMLAYNPGVRKGNMIIDNTPEKNANIWRQNKASDDFSSSDELNLESLRSESSSSSNNIESDNRRKMQALKLKGTYICSTRDVRDSFDCLGGIKILLPLFIQLSSSTNQNSNESENELNDMDRGIYFKILRLHFFFLRSTPENYRLINKFGFGLLSHFMDTLGPSYLSHDVLKELISRSELLIWNEAWQNDFIIEILCNFKLWKFSSFSVQLTLFDHLYLFILTNIDRAHKVITVSLLFDTLYLYYSDKQANELLSTKCIKLKSEDIFSSNDWKAQFSLTKKEVETIRTIILNTIYAMITNTSRTIDDDINMMFNYLIIESNPIYKLDVLQLFLKMLNLDKLETGNKVLSSMCIKHKINYLMNLIADNDTKVRLYALLGFCNTIHLGLMLGKISNQPTASIMNFFNQQSKNNELKNDDNLISNNDNNELNSKNINLKEENNQIKDNSDIFETLGIPINNMTSYFLWIQQKLKEKMKENCNSEYCNEIECRIIFTALSLAMLGISSKHLIFEIRNLNYNNEIDIDNHIDEIIIESDSNPETTSKRICIPMIIPSLLAYLQLESIKSSIRLNLLLRLQSSFHSFENYDIFLSVPNWQCYVFNCIAIEQNRVLFLQTHLDKTHDTLYDELQDEIKDSNTIIDVLTKIMSELHIHAIQFGFPSNSYFLISKPRDIRVVDFQSIGSKELLEIMKKDNRKIGCTVLRESISYLRTFTTKGYLDNGQITGIELLQKTVDTFQRENNSIMYSINNNNELLIRRKILELNVWLLTAFILDFIAIPPIQSSTMHSFGYSTKPGYLYSAVDSTFFSSNFLPELYKKATMANLKSESIYDDRETIGKLKKVAELTIAERNKLGIPIGSHNVEIPEDKLTTISLNSPINSINANSITTIDQTNISTSDAITVTNAMVVNNPDVSFFLTTNSGSVESPPRTLDSFLPNDSFSPDISRIDGSRTEDHILTSEDLRDTDQAIYLLKVWRLVDSLLTLLGPMGASSWISIDRVERLKTAFKVGVRLSRFALHLMQESVESLIQQPTPANIPLAPMKSTSSTGSTVLNRAIDGTFWIILRVLLDLFIHCSYHDGGSTDDEMNDVSINVLEKLSSMLNWLKDNSKEYFESESMYIAIKLVKAMRGMKDNQKGVNQDSSRWYSESWMMVTKLISEQRVHFFERIEALKKDSIDIDSGKDHMNINKKVNDSSPNNSESLLSPQISTSNTSNKSNNSNVTQDLVLDIINQSLQLPNIDKDDKITWNIWDKITEPILKETKNIENEIMSSKLNEFGFHKYSEESSKQLFESRRYEENQCTMIANKIIDIDIKVRNIENKRVKELSKIEEAKKKRYKTNWISVYEELANERGPWGALENSESLWVVDSCEDNYRMKRKLSKNPHGINFLPNFLKNSLEASEQALKNRMKSSMSTSSSTISSLVKNDDSLITTESENSRNPNILREVLKFTNAEKTIKQKDDDSDDEMIPQDGNEDRDKNISVDSSGLSLIKSNISDNNTNSPSNNNTTNNNNLISNLMDLTQDRVLFKAVCQVVTSASNSTNEPALGVLEITKSKITYTRGTDNQLENSSSYISRPRKNESNVTKTLWACVQFPNTQWSTSEIWNVAHRYYQLRFVAVEIFTTSRKSYFFNLFDRKTATKFQMVLRHMVKPPYMSPYCGKRPSSIILRATAPGSLLNLTVAWANREISNFDYLMRLNTIAGRTFNDLGQYPIFPWVIADYRSSELNLKDPRVYRDLRWPMGAQDIKQREMIAAKYADLKMAYDELKLSGEDDGSMMPPFHYGTHFSVAGFVLWYLMRLEPYTSLHVQLQDGRIDRPDRLFHSIEAAFRGCISNPSDVKELVPELFSNPDILQNVNNVNFGITQNNMQISDIVLPNWAKDPDDFIFKHREALESEYVSLHLHHWIDLIFGYKQRPPHLDGDEAAVTSCNVYYHLTYENAVDLEGLRASNQELYQQYVCQIAEYGQTPCQLFRKPHPSRQPLHKVDIIWPVASVVRGVHTLNDNEERPPMPRKIICFKEFNVSIWPIIFIAESGDRLITLDSTRVCGCHIWQVLSPDVVPPFRLKLDQAAYQVSKGQGNSLNSLLNISSYTNSNTNKEKRIGVPFAPVQHSNIKNNNSNLTMNQIQENTSQQKNGNNNKWRPPKVRSYEKEELSRSQLKRKSMLYLGSNDYSSASSSASTTPSSTPNRTRRKIPSMINPRSGKEEDNNISNASSNHSMIPNPPKVITSKSSSFMKLDEPLRLRASSSSMRSMEGGHSLNNGNTTSRILFNVGGNTRVLDEHLSAQQFAYLPDSKLIFTCFHWDHSCRVTAVETGNLIQSVRQHRDVITCLVIGKDFGQRWLITGSRDCTLMIWDINTERENGMPISTHPLHILYGHDDAVNCVDINPELDLVVSGSDDGTVILHNLRDGAYIRSIIDMGKSYTINRNIPLPPLSISEQNQSFDGTPTSSPQLLRQQSSASSIGSSNSSTTTAINNAPRGKITWLSISKEAYIVTYSEDDQLLCTFSLNGHLIASRNVPEALYALMLSEDGKVLITGGSSCLIVFRWVRTLELANDGPKLGFEAVLDGSMEEHNIPAMNYPIRSLHMTKLERHLIVGLESGEVRILAQDPNYLRQRLQNKLKEIGIL